MSTDKWDLEAAKRKAGVALMTRDELEERVALADTRRIVRFAVDPASVVIVALCNDGTMWINTVAHGKWVQLAPIPQPETETK